MKHNYKIGDSVITKNGIAGKIVALPDYGCFKGLVLWRIYAAYGKLGQLIHKSNPSDLKPFTK